MNTVIKIDKLGKKYIIKHEGAQRYTALRDVLTDSVKELGSRVISLFSQKEVQKQSQEELWALRDISFEVKKGERIGIIGRNGAGKSTLLKLLSRITEPSEGRIRLQGRVSSLLEVGTGFHPELTGKENIYLNGAILGMSRMEINRKFDEIVEFAEVKKFLDTPVKRYSSGMQVRLAFAIAAHLEPEILLVDEVLAVGDAAFQKKCLGKMEEVAHGGRTILFVSHNLVAIKSLCAKTILLDSGEMIFEGDTETALKKYYDFSTSKGERKRPGYFKTTNHKNPYQKDIIVKDIALLDQDNILSEQFYMGDHMKLSIGLIDFKKYPNAEVGVIIRNGMGIRLTSINTRMAGVKVSFSDCKPEYAVLTIPELPITPGDYYIDVTVGLRGVKPLDLVENAARFTVLENDVYQTGYRITSYYGQFYLNAYWEIVNDVNYE